MKIKKPPPDRFSFQAARGVLRKFCFPKNLPDSGWCSHNIGEHFPINHQPRHSSLIKSLYGNSVRKHVNEHSWLCGWVILSILAHLAHLAQSYISRINSATNTCKCSWFDLTSRKICSDWKQKLGEKWPMLTTFFLTATAAITGKNVRSGRLQFDTFFFKLT